jgi:hypothetical protein
VHQSRLAQVLSFARCSADFLGLLDDAFKASENRRVLLDWTTPLLAHEISRCALHLRLLFSVMLFVLLLLRRFGILLALRQRVLAYLCAKLTPDENETQRSIIEHKHALIHRFVSVLLSESTPLLLVCNSELAPRQSLAVAVLLSSLNFDDALIVKEDLLFREELAQKQPPSKNYAEIGKSLELIREKHASVEAFLEHISVGVDQQRQLRKKFLVF